MKPLAQLTARDLQKIKLICFDCDGVTVKKGTDIQETETTLTVKTATLSDRMLAKLIRLKKRFFLNFSSGRNVLYLERMYGKILWDKASLQGENGIFTLIDGRVIQHEFFSPEDLEKIRLMKVALRDLQGKDKRIRGFEPKQFLITVHCWEEVEEITEVVKTYDPNNRYYCWWNGEAYDISLKTQNKGRGLKKLCEYLKINSEYTLSIGNGINDKDMVEAAGIGVTTEPKSLETDYFTQGSQELGGEELADKLLELI